MAKKDRIILGIDPGLANTGWGVVHQAGSALECVAYGCVSTPADVPIANRLDRIYGQISAVIRRFGPTCLGIETIWFGQNVTAAFGTGQARGAALVACAQGGLDVGEFTPRQIKMAVVGTGAAEKEQVQYMVQHILRLDEVPNPDHAADALAAAICYTTHEGASQASGRYEKLVEEALAKQGGAAGAGGKSGSRGFDAAVERALAKEAMR